MRPGRPVYPQWVACPPALPGDGFARAQGLPTPGAETVSQLIEAAAMRAGEGGLLRCGGRGLRDGLAAAGAEGVARRRWPAAVRASQAGRSQRDASGRYRAFQHQVNLAVGLALPAIEGAQCVGRRLLQVRLEHHEVLVGDLADLMVEVEVAERLKRSITLREQFLQRICG